MAYVEGAATFLLAPCAISPNEVVELLNILVCRVYVGVVFLLDCDCGVVGRPWDVCWIGFCKKANVV